MAGGSRSGCPHGPNRLGRDRRASGGLSPESVGRVRRPSPRRDSRERCPQVPPRARFTPSRSLRDSRTIREAVSACGSKCARDPLDAGRLSTFSPRFPHEGVRMWRGRRAPRPRLLEVGSQAPRRRARSRWMRAVPSSHAACSSGAEGPGSARIGGPGSSRSPRNPARHAGAQRVAHPGGALPKTARLGGTGTARIAG